MKVKVPAHTRKNGVKVKAYSYTVGGKTAKTGKGKAKRRTKRRMDPGLKNAHEAIARHTKALKNPHAGKSAKDRFRKMLRKARAYVKKHG